jgi:hypothetical protein
LIKFRFSGIIQNLFKEYMPESTPVRGFRLTEAAPSTIVDLLKGAVCDDLKKLAKSGEAGAIQVDTICGSIETQREAIQEKLRTTFALMVESGRPHNVPIVLAAAAGDAISHIIPKEYLFAGIASLKDAIERQFAELFEEIPLQRQG